MAKTIQVRVDDELKESADTLFSSLGLDISTAVRMFLVASTETGGIPFMVRKGIDPDSLIDVAIARRKAGDYYYTAEEFMAGMREAIAEGIYDVRG